MGNFPFPHPPATPRPPRDNIAPAVSWINGRDLPTGWVLVADSETGVVEVQWRKQRHAPDHRPDLVRSLLEEVYGPADVSTRVGVAIWPRVAGRPAALVVEGVTVR